MNENLERRDFKSDMYRVVYFGKYEEVRRATASHPTLIPFLPLNITIFAEGDQTILVASHPQALRQFFPDATLKPLFNSGERTWWRSRMTRVKASSCFSRAASSRGAAAPSLFS